MFGDEQINSFKLPASESYYKRLQGAKAFNIFCGTGLKMRKTEVEVYKLWYTDLNFT